jgi:hypothetical protein
LLPSAIGTQSYWLSCCWLKNVLGSMLWFKKNIFAKKNS